MKMKKLSVVLLSLLVAVMVLSGCGGGAQDNDSAESAENGAKNSDQAILVVSFGTSYNDSRDKTIGAIETAAAEAFPEYEVRRAFTSQIIIDKLKERDNLEIDNVTEALDRAVADGIKTLIVQPTHLMNGYEYTYRDKFEKIALGEPLLTSEEDFRAVAETITSETSSYDDGKTAICFMGHGTEADSNQVYTKMQQTLAAMGKDAYYIGTVEAEPTLEDVMAAMKDKGYSRVVLEPLMVDAGDHANNDMAGDEEDSWKSQLQASGYEVECVLKGLGEFEGIQDIYTDHIRAAVDSLS